MTSGNVHEIINGEYTINFICQIEPLKTEYLYNPLNLIEYDNDYFRVAQLEELHNEDNIITVSITAEHISYDLIKDTMTNFSYTNKAAIFVMNEALLNTNFIFNGTDVTTTASIDLAESVEGAEDLNVKNIIHSIALIWGGELQYFRNQIELLQQRGQNRGVDFRFGKNIKNIKRIVNFTENTTSYDVAVIQGAELEELGFYDIGDTIRVIDDALELNYEVRIIELTRDIVTGINSQVILGQPIKDLSSQISDIFDGFKKVSSKIDQTADTVNTVIDANGKLIASKITGTLNTAETIIKNSGGNVSYDDRGIIIHDQPLENQSTWAVLLSSGGILISDAKDINGAWIWRTALTGVSISADAMTTGTLTAININGVNITGSTITGSTLISENGTYKIKIENGKIIIYDTANASNLGAQIGYTSAGNIEIDCDLDNNFSINTYSSDGMSGDLKNRLYILYNNVKGALVETEMRYRGTDIDDIPYGEFNVNFGTNSSKNKFNVKNGIKNALITTEQFGDVTFSAYEMAEVLLGDMGESEVVNGECTITIADKLLACVNTDTPYQVFLQAYGNGKIYIEQRNATSFVVKGDNVKFGWEVKAKRKNFENIRFGQ